MRNGLLFSAALAFAGCATAPAHDAPVAEVAPHPAQTQIVTAAPDLATQEHFDARVEAARFDHAADCEQVARGIKTRNADRAWKLLRACVDRSDFTEIRMLLAGPWDDLLQKRSDAPEMITKLIAVRGGAVEDDVALLHDHRVPVFTLADAMAEPDVYAGRLVVLRARVSDLRKSGAAVSVTLDEYTHRSDLVDAQVGRAHERTRTVGRTDKWAGGSTDHHAVTVHDRDYKTDKRMASDDVETGRSALGKMAQADPFLEPDKDFIVLGRFDGLRGQSGEDGDGQMAVLTVLHYFRPASLAIY